MRPRNAAEYRPATTPRLTNAGPKGATASAPSPIANGSVTTAVIVPARTLRRGSTLTSAGEWKDVHGEGAGGRKMRDSRITGSASPAAAEASVDAGSGFIDRPGGGPPCPGSARCGGGISNRRGPPPTPRYQRLPPTG